MVNSLQFVTNVRKSIAEGSRAVEQKDGLVPSSPGRRDPAPRNFRVLHVLAEGDHRAPGFLQREVGVVPLAKVRVVLEFNGVVLGHQLERLQVLLLQFYMPSNLPDPMVKNNLLHQKIL